MSSLSKFKHTIKEINETKVRIIEDKVSRDRVDFLQKLLKHNGIETLIEEVPPKTEEDETTWTIGTTDILFNPIVRVYNRDLRTFNNERVTPDYWNQLTDQAEPNYWDRSKKDF